MRRTARRASRPQGPVSIIGAGRAATAIAKVLRRAGVRVEFVWSRRVARARVLARLVGAGAVREAGYALASPVVLVAVSDSAIARLSGRLARAFPGGKRGGVVLHLAGALGPGVLAALRRKGASVGVWHPLASFGGESPASFSGIAFGIGGDPAAVKAAIRLTRAVGGHFLRVPDRGWGAYHAAASVAANGMTGLLDLAFDLWRAAGLSRRDALRALPFLVGTAHRNACVSYAKGGEAASALTGPVRRRDLATLRLHLAALPRRDDLREGYTDAQRLALRAARKAGMPAANLRRIATLLSLPRR